MSFPYGYSGFCIKKSKKPKDGIKKGLTTEYTKICTKVAKKDNIKLSTNSLCSL